MTKTRNNPQCSLRMTWENIMTKMGEQKMMVAASPTGNRANPMNIHDTVRHPMTPCKYTRSRRPFGPNGFFRRMAMAGRMRSIWIAARKTRTSDGSIRGKSLTVTEQRVKNSPETAARNMPMNFIDTSFSDLFLSLSFFFVELLVGDSASRSDEDEDEELSLISFS